MALEGDLGAGKTVFAQGMGDGLGVPDAVTSPTFTLIHEYRRAGALLPRRPLPPLGEAEAGKPRPG